MSRAVPAVFVAFAFLQPLPHENPSANSSYSVKPWKESLVKGVTLVAPPREIGPASFEHLKSIHASWVCLVPYGFMRPGSPDVRYGAQWQWWGEKKEGILKCVEEAKRQKLRVMLKPQVYIPGGWTGDVSFDSEEKWERWEASYKEYILDFACLAGENGIEMFCIGTEFDRTTASRKKFWFDLVAEVRKIYHGYITYSANWDSFDKVTLWPSLDVIGISGYFPLDDKESPEVRGLVEKWKPVAVKLDNFSRKMNKKILFSEYGYMSVDGCAGKVWEVEKNRDVLNVNHAAQSNSYDALWSSLHSKEFWAGGFTWKWFPEGMGHEGYPEKDYTPQGKPAEKILEKWFSKKY